MTATTMARALLSLGSNMGDSEELLRQALADMRAFGTVEAVSSFYYSKAMYNEDMPDFVNLAAALRTSLQPLELLDALQTLERKAGRTRQPYGHRYQPRPLDIDIIDYDGLRLNHPRLTLPHPLWQERPFVVEPLSEVAKDFIG